jgi:hypothetical protein
MVRALRQAVAQTTVPEDPTDAGILRESGAQIRTLLRDARTSGARLAQFPERGNRLPGQVRDVLGRAGHAGGSRLDTSRLGHHGRRGRGDPPASPANWVVDCLRFPPPAHPAEPPAQLPLHNLPERPRGDSLRQAVPVAYQSHLDVHARHRTGRVCSRRATDFARIRSVGTGSWITRSEQGHGNGTEAGATVLELAFGQLGVRKPAPSTSPVTTPRTRSPVSSGTPTTDST